MKLSRVLLVLVLAACGSKGKARSLLPIDITASPDVGTIDSVRIFITQGPDAVTDQTIAWTATAGQPMKVGLYLPDSVDGAINVEANAQDATGAVIGASAIQPATVHSGQTADLVTLRIDRKSSGDGGVEIARAHV